MLKKLFSHSLIYGVTPQLTKVASFFALPLITSELTDVDFGVSGTITAYTGALAVLSTLGLRVILVNTFYKSPGQYKWAWRQLFGFLNIWNFFYALIVTSLIYFIVPEVAEENKWAIIGLTATPLILFGQTSNIGASYYQLAQKPVQIAVRNTLFGFMTIGLNVIFIAKYKMGYMGWFLSSFIVDILRNTSYLFPVYFRLGFKPIYNFKWRFIKHSLRVSIPLIPHYYSIYLLNSSDRVVMSLMNISTKEIGRYNASETLSNIVGSANQASNMAIGPLITQCYRKKEYKNARNLIFVLQATILMLAFILSLWLKEAFAFLIRNESLAQMYYLGIILVMSQTYRPMYIGFSSKYMYHEKTSNVLKISFGAGVINVILNIILIPFWGFEVAAITTFIGYMYMGYSGYSLNSFKKINNIKYYPTLWLSLTVILTILAYIAVEFSIVIKSILTTFFLLMIIGITIKNYKKFK